MNWHFRTIGMGTVNYRRAAVRLAREVESTRLFETSIGFSEDFLRDQSKVFWANHKSVLKARVPGFGWWIWKPEFIARCLEQVPEGDGVFYLDAGSFVSNSEDGLQETNKMLAVAREQSVVVAHGQHFIERNFTSTELMNFLGLTASQRESPQHYAGFLLVLNNKKGREFVDKWRHLACASNHNYLIPSLRSPQDIELNHHMYDQAILSCLAKKFGETSIEVGDKQKDGPIRLIRHRYAYGISEKRKVVILFYKLIGLASKLKLAIEHRIFRDSLSMRPPNHD